MTHLFIKCVSKSCYSPNWFIKSCYQSALSRVIKTASMTCSCAECFQKCFSAENFIILSLNTVISIIVMVWLSKVNIAIRRLLLFNVSVLSNAYHFQQ